MQNQLTDDVAQLAMSLKGLRGGMSNRLVQRMRSFPFVMVEFELININRVSSVGNSSEPDGLTLVIVAGNHTPIVAGDVSKIQPLMTYVQ